MTNLLDEAYAAAKELPEEEQEAIGAVIGGGKNYCRNHPTWSNA
jgi:hypothetical protein